MKKGIEIKKRSFTLWVCFPCREEPNNQSNKQQPELPHRRIWTPTFPYICIKVSKIKTFSHIKAFLRGAWSVLMP